MANQNSVSDYAKAIDYQLSSIFTTIPVYASFNRNWATQPSFVTWQLRNVHQPVYTGSIQSNKGIDRPIFQVTIFSTKMADAFNFSNTLIQALHGYSGQFGGSAGFGISKCDVNWLHNTYDDTIGLFSIFLDCTIDIPA